ncbi:MAG: hypothetical protein CV087_08785 [Candidatus Brocadia sp. WS118]|nr:MAG: hypothetical protein CV087_08785 [Candidatus Brocadia sp. WS118]
MLFKYIGDNNEAPQKTIVFGYEFTLNGEFVNVVEPQLIDKLKNNKTFALVENTDEVASNIDSANDANNRELSYREKVACIIAHGGKIINRSAESVEKQYQSIIGK